MMSLQSSRDPDGMYEMDEMEELLKEEGEEFDNDSRSDASEDIIFQQPSHFLSFKQKRYLQSLPAGSLVGQIAHRLEQERTPLPFYLFWPWPKMRASLKALVWLGWLAVIVAAFWPIFQMYLFPRYCHERVQSKAWWLKGPLLKVDFSPNSSLSFLEEHSNVMMEVDVKIIHLSSPSWLMNIHNFPELSTAELEGELKLLKEICSFCHSHEMKVVISINVTEVVQQLTTVVKDHNLNEQEDLQMKHRNGTANGNCTQDSDPLHSYLLRLIGVGVDGFFVEDSGNSNLDVQNELLKSFTKLKNESKKDILFGIDSSLALNSSFTGLTDVELDESCFSTASDLDLWMKNLFLSKPRATILWKLPQQVISGSNNINLNLNLLGLVLPGIPVLERTRLKQLNGDNTSESLLKKLLLLRKSATTLQEKDYSALKDKDYLKQNVYAILRSYQEEKRYLILWNLSNSSVASLDFHSLSIQGQWMFKSIGDFGSSSFKMNNVENLLPYELAVIELP